MGGGPDYNPNQNTNPNTSGAGTNYSTAGNPSANYGNGASNATDGNPPARTPTQMVPLKSYWQPQRQANQTFNDQQTGSAGAGGDRTANWVDSQNGGGSNSNGNGGSGTGSYGQPLRE